MGAPGARGLLGRILLAPTGLLAGIAGLVYAGALPVEHDVRGRVAFVIGAVALCDALLAVSLILLDRP